MAGEEVSGAAGPSRPLNHIESRPIMPLHVEVGGGKVRRAPASQVPGDGERLEKHLGQDHGAAPVHGHSSLVQIGQ